MFKKMLALALIFVLAISCVACGKEPEPTEPVATLPTNVFTNQSDELDWLIVDDVAYRMNSGLPDKLRENGYIAGTNDTATCLYLGYPKSDAKYLYYQVDNESANCVYCCIIDNKMTVTISYRVIEPYRLGANDATYTNTNSKTYYANYLSPDKTVDDVMEYMGTPDSAETNSSGFVTKLIYENKNAEGKVDNKLEVEFVGERVYKVTITKRLHE